MSLKAKQHFFFIIFTNLQMQQLKKKSKVDILLKSSFSFSKASSQEKITKLEITDENNDSIGKIQVEVKEISQSSMLENLPNQKEDDSGKWTDQEIKTLFELFKEMGSRWTIIAKLIPGKSDNTIKNKFNCCIRKLTRKLNRINKEVNKKFKKQIRNESIFRILKAAHTFPNMQQGMKLKGLEIRQNILLYAQKQEQVEQNQQLITLIYDINSFNLKTRSHKNPKHKQNYFNKDFVLLEPSNQSSNGQAHNQQKKPFEIIRLQKEQVHSKPYENDAVEGNACQPDLMKSYTSVNLLNLSVRDPQINAMLPLEYDVLAEEKKNCFLNMIDRCEEFLFRKQQQFEEL